MQHKTIKSPVGDLTLFATEKGICRLTWGKAQPEKNIPSAAAEKHLQQAEKELRDYFNKKSKVFETKMDLDSSVYAKSVLAEVKKVKAGEVKTYGDIAQKLKSAPRAVGRAVGANPIPIFIPCHRIMGAGGKLTGFSGGDGIPTKKWLLIHEGTLND